MQWFFDVSNATTTLKEYFSFNRINHHDVTLWQEHLDTYGRHDIPDRLLHGHDQVLVIDCQVLLSLLEWPQSMINVNRFINNSNHVWVWNNLDGLVQLTAKNMREKIQELDRSIERTNVTIFLDAMPVQDHWLNELNHIRTEVQPWQFFMMKGNRIIGAKIDKCPDAKDFVLSTVLKKSAPHRSRLKQEFDLRPHLWSRGNINFSAYRGDLYDPDHEGKANKTNYLGESYDWLESWEMYPSMDLYRNSCLELVPETLCAHGYFVTEKTVKPISTKTPFLMLSTPGYLKYLRSKGFRTFHHLIDEGYDDIVDLDTRVRAVVDLLEHVIATGSRDFFEASKDIVEHNHARLLEIMGRKTYDTDLLIADNIAKITVDRKL